MNKCCKKLITHCYFLSANAFANVKELDFTVKCYVFTIFIMIIVGFGFCVCWIKESAKCKNVKYECSYWYWMLHIVEYESSLEVKKLSTTKTTFLLFKSVIHMLCYFRNMSYVEVYFRSAFSQLLVEFLIWKSKRIHFHFPLTYSFQIAILVWKFIFEDHSLILKGYSTFFGNRLILQLPSELNSWVLPFSKSIQSIFWYLEEYK